MDKYKMSLEEKETHITFDEINPNCTIYTSNKSLMRRLNILCKNYPDAYEVEYRDQQSGKYNTEKDNITFKVPSKRLFTEEQKLEARERMIKLHSTR